jgi:hypothetical protein
MLKNVRRVLWASTILLKLVCVELMVLSIRLCLYTTARRAILGRQLRENYWPFLFRKLVKGTMHQETKTSAVFRTWGNPLFSVRSGTNCSDETPTRAGDSVWEQPSRGKTQTECVLCTVGTTYSWIHCLSFTLRISEKTANGVLRDSL